MASGEEARPPCERPNSTTPFEGKLSDDNIELPKLDPNKS
jgi:hypothetical protein